MDTLTIEEAFSVVLEIAENRQDVAVLCYKLGLLAVKMGDLRGGEQWLEVGLAAASIPLMHFRPGPFAAHGRVVILQRGDAQRPLLPNPD